jgi:hypothetical protein
MLILMKLWCECAKVVCGSDIGMGVWCRAGGPSGRCPQRLRDIGETGSTKSFSGRRVVGLPAPLVELLREPAE